MKYNVLGDGFYLKSFNGKNQKGFELEENPSFTCLKTNQFDVLNLKEDGRKSIKFVTPIVDDSSIAMELRMNNEKKIESCSIDFKTYKNNKKMNGFYELRIASLDDENKYSIRFINRKGGKYYDFFEELLHQDDQLCSIITREKLTMEFIDELLQKIIPILSNHADHFGGESILVENKAIVSNFVAEKNQAICFIQQIKGEIPLPYLQKNLEKFILENDNVLKNSKKRGRFFS